DDHPNTLMVMSNLAGAYTDDEQYEKAEALLLQRIPLSKQRYGENHWRVATGEDGLGRFYLNAKNFERAEEMFKKSTALYSESLGVTHNWTAISTVYLAFCKAVNGSTEESDILFRDSYATLLSNKDNFEYYEKTMFEIMLNFLKMHPMNVWHEEIALLEELKK
ncbi:MAG: tetratricopeptide repeat protein, partial [Cyclonatronaceae bacterium]